MTEIIELFRPHTCGKNLLEIFCLKDNTVRIYLDMVYKYTDYAKQFLHINPLTSKTWHIHKWMYHLKTKDKGYNFLKDAKVAIIFNFVEVQL